MENNENQIASNTKKLSPLMAGVITGLVALLGPVGITWYSISNPSDFSMAAMAWVYYSSLWGTPYGNFMIDPFMLIASLPYTFLRIVFVWFVYRLYSGKTTLKRTAIIGIAAELQLPVFYIISYLPMLLMNPGWYFPPLLIPTPLLILIGFLLTKVYPLPEDKLWIERDQTQSWWETKEVETDAPREIEDSTSQTEDDWLKESES